MKLGVSAELESFFTLSELSVIEDYRFNLCISVRLVFLRPALLDSSTDSFISSRTWLDF